jgi:hypothetical protein
MLYELDVIDAVCDDLEKRGYTIVSRKNEIRHSGSDIKAKKADKNLNERYFIETVGGTSSNPSSSRYGQPFDNSQSKVHVSEQLYACVKILSGPKIEGFSYRVGMAFEDNEYYRRYIEEIKNTLKKLEIDVILVDNSKRVQYL